MNTALLGYSGFVGSALQTQFSYTDVYNSANIDDIRGKHYDLIVCAAAPGAKWIANKFPDADFRSIQRLIENIRLVQTKKFVLISTIDVYPVPVEVNEATRISTARQPPYGKNRYILETAVRKHFDTYTIVRLPALFGTGLKKNFVYDLICDKPDMFPNPGSTFQFYPTVNLWRDIQIALTRKIPLINFATEPISASDIASYSLAMTLPPANSLPRIRYDMHTSYASLFGKKGPYMYTRTYIIHRIKSFIQKEKH